MKLLKTSGFQRQPKIFCFVQFGYLGSDMFSWRKISVDHLLFDKRYDIDFMSMGFQKGCPLEWQEFFRT